MGRISRTQGKGRKQEEGSGQGRHKNGWKVPRRHLRGQRSTKAKAKGVVCVMGQKKKEVELEGYNSFIILKSLFLG